MNNYYLYLGMLLTWNKLGKYKWNYKNENTWNFHCTDGYSIIILLTRNPVTIPLFSTIIITSLPSQQLYTVTKFNNLTFCGGCCRITPLLDVVVWPAGDVTDTQEGSFAWTSILYPGGKKVLNPTINSGCPLNSDETLLITPGVSMLRINL